MHHIPCVVCVMSNLILQPSDLFKDCYTNNEFNVSMAIHILWGIINKQETVIMTQHEKIFTLICIQNNLA